MKRNLLLGILTGVLLGLSFPPFKTGFLAYFVLIPFFLLLEDKHGFSAFRWGYISGLFADIATLFWIGWVTVPGMIGALLVLPLFWGFYAFLHTFLYRRLQFKAYLVVPFLWTAVEYLQSAGETAFPWNFLGYSQSYYLPFIQFAEYLAVFGVSFWVVSINCTIFLLWKKWSLPRLRSVLAIILGILFLLPAVHGIIRMSDNGVRTEKIKIALLQGNIDPFEKWDKDLYDRNFKVYTDLADSAIKGQPDLMIWPETATPFYLRYEMFYLERVKMIADTANLALLTGSVDFDYDDNGDYRYYNSALGFEANLDYIQKYAKMLLVPFSERVPYKNYFPFNVLKNLLFDMALGVGDYSQGSEYKLFTFHPRSWYLDKNNGNAYQAAVAICYESVFPDHIAKLTRMGANILIIITNDAWFGKTSAPHQHQQIAVFRAIENRIPVARCANTGVSCFIDEYGHVSRSTALFEQALIEQEVALTSSCTFYAKYRFLLPLITLIVTLTALIFSIAKRK
ncbi:MAG TPA: apolipoprotein N-acyltransferase [bacterium]|nr:apolipoprotein N-acyltransferase [bacterium]HPN43113.1 apolipoprotein N-acyltransferase [bacterium]